MASINIRRILIIAALAVMESAAAAADSTAPSPLMAAVDFTNTVTSQELIIEWLKITAVPFGVFLIGACTWGCIKNTAAWRILTGRGGESDAHQTVELQAADGSIHHDSPHASDLEKGPESSQRPEEDGLAMSAQTLLPMHQPTLEFPSDEERSAAIDVAPEL